MEHLLSSTQVAEMLGIKNKTLEQYRHHQRHDLMPPFIRIGRTVRYERETVIAWLKANVVGAPL